MMMQKLLVHDVYLACVHQAYGVHHCSDHALGKLCVNHVYEIAPMCCNRDKTKHSCSAACFYIFILSLLLLLSTECAYGRETRSEEGDKTKESQMHRSTM